MSYSCIMLQNNGISTLASPVVVGATILAVASSASYPQTGAFMCTIWNKSVYQDPSTDPGMEIVMVTTVNGNNFTILKGQEGTVDISHAAGSNIEALITPSMAKEIQARINAPYNTKVITANYTLQPSDYLVQVNASGGPLAVIFPNATLLPGQEFIIKKVDASKNTVTIEAIPGQTIDGVLSQVISVSKASFTVSSDGSNWIIT